MKSPSESFVIQSTVRLKLSYYRRIQSSQGDESQEEFAAWSNRGNRMIGRSHSVHCILQTVSQLLDSLGCEIQRSFEKLHTILVLQKPVTYIANAPKQWEASE